MIRPPPRHRSIDHLVEWKGNAMRRLVTILLLLCALMPLWSAGALAQDATPEPAAAGPPDLAAMALAAEDVPAGYFDEYSDWLVPADAFADLVLGGPAPAGLARAYQSFYFAPEIGGAVHVFLLEFASAEEATSGGAIVDAILRPPLPEGKTIGPEHAAGPQIGDAPSTVTTVTLDTWAAGGPRADVVAVSFQRDRLVAGVTAERFTDPPADGSPTADEVSPMTDPDGQEQLATELAETLDGRIADVLAGGTPAGVDTVLAGSLLPIEQLVDPATPIFGGYIAGADLLRCGVCGEENALAPFVDTVQDGVVRGLSAGPLVDGEPSPPFVAIAIAEFALPDDALAALEAIRQSPNDRPTSIPIPRGTKTLADSPTIPGADDALAFTATADEENPDAPADSAGVDLVVGNLLVTIDVQGGLTGDEALAATEDLATQQVACLTSGGPCQEVQAPAALTTAPGTEATPTT